MQIANRLFCDTFHAKNIDIVGAYNSGTFTAKYLICFLLGKTTHVPQW